MKSVCFSIFFFGWCVLRVAAQSGGFFDLQLDTVTIPGLPGLHSFAAAIHSDKWMLIGRRRDGMHQKFNAFQTPTANQQIYVVDPAAGRVWQRPISELPDTLQEQSQPPLPRLQPDAQVFANGEIGLVHLTR